MSFPTASLHSCDVESLHLTDARGHLLRIFFHGGECIYLLPVPPLVLLPYLRQRFPPAEAFFFFFAFPIRLNLRQPNPFYAAPEII